MEIMLRVGSDAEKPGVDSAAPGHPARPSFHVPAIASDVIERPRVIGVLSSAVSENRITMLVGNHGAGKTTAASHWAARTEELVVWINAEESAGAPWEFYADLVDELQAAAQLTDLDAVVAGTGEPRPLRRMGLSLARELYRRRTEAVVIVDRAELLSEECLGLVAALVSGSLGLRFLLLATHLDEDFILAAETQHQAVLLDTDFLMLTKEETSQALSSAGLHDIDDGALSELSSPLVLRSLVARCRRRGARQISSALIGDLQRELAVQSMRRVLAEGTLGEDPLPVLLISLAQMADAELASKLLNLGRDRAHRVLVDMHRAGLGTKDGDGVLRVDSALTVGLREVAAERLTAVQRERAHGVIAEWYQERGRPWEAIQHAEIAGEWQLIAEILLVHYDQIPRGKLNDLLKILHRIPRDVMRLYPYLGWFRMMLLGDQPDTTRARLHAAGEEVLSALDPGAEGVQALINRAVMFAYHYVIGEFEQADEVITSLLPVVEGIQAMGAGALADLPAEQHYVVEASRTWVGKAMRQYAASTKLFLGERSCALSLIEPTIEPIGQDGWMSWRSLYSAGLKALILATEGNMTQARHVLDDIHSCELPPGWDESYLGTPACLAAAHLALAECGPDTARVELERIKRYQGSSDLWAFILDLRARISLYDKESGAVSYIAAELYARRERPPTSRYMQIHLQARAAAAALLAGAIPTGRKYLSRGWELDYPNRPGVSLEYTEAAMALSLKDWQRARSIVAEMLATRELTLREEIGLRLSWVHAEVELSGQESSEGSLEEAGGEFLHALSLADDGGTAQDVLLLPPDMLSMLLKRFAPFRRDIAEAARRRQLSGEYFEAPELTESEERVLEELVYTDSRPAIAAALYLSENTVKTHLRKIYKKLGVHSRTEALELAYRCGLSVRTPSSSTD